MKLKNKYFKTQLTMLIPEWYIADDYVQEHEFNKRYYYEDFRYVEDLLTKIDSEPQSN